MANIFQIPGNIKQQYLPFVLNPHDALNKNATSSNKLQHAHSQYFSFRNRDRSKCKGGFGRVQVCPSSLTNVDFGSNFKKDISFQTLYGQLDKKDRKKSPLTVDDVLEAMPGVQIREFLPDTKLDQCINFMGDMMDSFKEMMASNDDTEKTKLQEAKDTAKKDGKKLTDAEIRAIKNASQATFWKRFRACLYHVFDYMTGTGTATAPSDNLYYKDGKPRFAGQNGGIYSNKWLDSYVLTWPYQLYYRLQSCVTTNVYELPGKTIDDLMYSAKGMTGWEGGKAIGLGNQFLTKIPIIGSILNNILGNIQINYMPWWDSGKGSGTQPPEVQIKFDLFNDTAEAAMMNFIFVNTIVPNNLWIQYGMFQHSSHLYDVKIEGYNRLFACSGNFNVKSKGVLRVPPPGWVDTLCAKHGNGGRGGKGAGGNINVKKLAESIKKDNLIKIPDIYEVEMTFVSLLPLNFNNYIFTYSNNNRIDTEYVGGGKKVYQEGALATVVKSCTTDFIKEMKSYITDKTRQENDIATDERFKS